MHKRILLIVATIALFLAGYFVGGDRVGLAFADQKPGGVPKSYGHLVSAVVTPGGTSLIFEDSEGTIRFVTMTGQVESELERK